MPDELGGKTEDERTFVEVFGDQIITVDEAASIRDWLAEPAAFSFLRMLDAHNRRVIETNWIDFRKDIPALNLERGRTLGYTDILGFKEAIRDGIKNPMDVATAKSEGYSV